MSEEQARIEAWFIRLTLRRPRLLSDDEWCRWMPLLWQSSVLDSEA